MTLPTGVGDEEFFVRKNPYVYLQDERVYAIVVSYGAYVSRVRYLKDGVLFDVVVENNEFMDGD